MASVFRKLMRKFIEHCPSSKRSIKDLRAQVSDLQTSIDRMQRVLDEQLPRILENQRNMHVDMLTNREHASLLAWANYRNENESDFDARKRFYYGLPQATGSVRLIQRGCASLLSEFAAVAKEYNLQYWADFGTLLGTIRHRGFIPWDDDTDLGMMRSDVDKLLELLKKDEKLSKRYRAVLVFDPYVFCRQLRLRYKNSEDPSFIDIFFYDYMPKYDEHTKRRFIEIREELKEDLRSKPFYNKWLANGYLEDGEELSSEIENIFTKYQNIAKSENIIADDVTSNESNNECNIIYGLDNVDSELIYTSQYEDMFPLRQEKFEKFEILVPNKAEKILFNYYGNIYQLPSDIVSHLQHVSRELLNNKHTIEAIKQDIETNPYTCKQSIKFSCIKRIGVKITSLAISIICRILHK